LCPWRISGSDRGAAPVFRLLVDVLSQQLGQQPLRLSKGLRRRGVLRISPQSPRCEGERDARIRHELTDNGPSLLRIAPVEIEAAFKAGGEMPTQPLDLHDLISLPALEAADLVYDVPNPV
jgi:hypothetical protein